MEQAPKNKDVDLQSGILSEQELVICRRIATSEPPDSQRAAMLIALHKNVTQAEAAEQTGLSPGQVKYWAAKFKRQRLGIFPDALLETPVQESIVPEGTPDLLNGDNNEPRGAPALAKSPKKKKKAKKSARPEKTKKVKKVKKKEKAKKSDKKKLKKNKGKKKGKKGKKAKNK